MTEYVDQQLGNYRLVRHLGRGAFGDVYLGVHVHLKTPAAIKVLHTALTSSDVEKFRTEARTIARLEHPHMVRVLDFGIQDYTPFLVMSYAPNGTLRQSHPKGTTLPLATIISYVSQVAGALQYIHQHKLIHRDIKPENMLLGRNNQVLLSDFGFVQMAQSSISQSSKEMAGTIPYMAPEQFNGKPRPASDQYSLGIVVYEWLIGERPFQGSVLEIITQHIQNPPPPMRTVNPDIPPEVEEVVFTALAKDPQQRFATVQAFANALQQASNIEAPIASVSTLSFQEISELPSFGTQPLAAVAAPVEFPRYNEPALNVHADEESFSNTPSSEHQHTTKVPTVTDAPQKRRLSRRAVLFGLAGVAIGSVVSNGLWIAKSAGLLGDITPTTLLPLGTTLYTYTGHKGSVLTAAWSLDGYRIASGSTDNTVQVWDGATGWHSSTYAGHKDWVWSVAWSPDGNYIASGGGSHDRTVQVWNVATKKSVSIFDDYTDGVSSVAWSPDGKLIASGCYDKLVRVRDPFTQTIQFTLKGHTGGVKSVAWAPNGKYIASGSFDHTVKVWDASTGMNLYTLTHTNYVKSVTWSPDSKHIASSTGDTSSQGNGEHLVYVWDATTRKLVHKYYGHHDEVATVTWSPDGKLIASASGNLNSGEGDTSAQVWEALSGNQVLNYTRHHKMVNSLAWAPEGSRIASASWDMTVQVWKAE